MKRENTAAAWNAEREFRGPGPIVPWPSAFPDWCASTAILSVCQQPLLFGMKRGSQHEEFGGIRRALADHAILVQPKKPKNTVLLIFASCY
ncbi:MAG: hypothetical protein A3F68_08610 [Acidobacteria bacterium RIFCSPLOWO2_12_FULL_54_10]|nr:MAG: hypothetical protein A3F68_08610 [Acidobacteria bacterium RIFCSPLOWO2_12_FULL_54_10]